MSSQVTENINQFWNYEIPPQWDIVGIILFLVLTIVAKTFDILREHKQDSPLIQILNENTLNTLNSLIALMFTEALYNTRFMEDYAKTKMLFLITLLVVLFYTPRQTKRSVIAKVWGVLEEKIHLKLDSITLSTQELRNLQTNEFNELRSKYFELVDKLNEVHATRERESKETKDTTHQPRSKPEAYFSGNATEMCCTNKGDSRKGGQEEKEKVTQETKDCPVTEEVVKKRST